MAVVVGNSGYEIQDGCIMSYGVRNGEVNFNDEGKLQAIDKDQKEKIEKALGIDSIEEFGVVILNNEKAGTKNDEIK